VKAVIPICNAHAEPDKGTNRTKGKGRDYAAEIHYHLTEQYVPVFFVQPLLTSIRICFKHTRLEADRYPSFILAMNSALEALREVKDLPSELRMASNADPLFHQNDPMPIKGTHSEESSTRKPDVVLVSMRSASTAVGPDAAWTDYAFKTGIKPPDDNFG
jgi:hypothetical protein